MNRKTMDDIVVHRQNQAVSAGSQSALSPKKQPMVSAGVTKNTEGGYRIENNPFFSKPTRSMPPSEKKTVRSHMFLWIFSIVLLGVTGFLVANYFAAATVNVVPLTYAGHIDQDFTASKDTGALSKDGLIFHFISLNDEKSVDVAATTAQDVQKKASGRVVIYNAYSKDAQRLIKNTRLESADHKIFRIDQSVVVPGAKISGGVVTQPGFVEALVFADVPGKDYNIGLGDFTIPGFKGDPRYTKFTARSKTDSPISGGYAGTVNVPAGFDVQKAQDDLKSALKSSAVEKARALIPEGMTFFPGSTIIKFEEVPQDYSTSDTAKVTVKATVSVFFFDTNSLTQKIASSSLANYQGNPVSLANSSALIFSFIDPVNNVVLSDLPSVRFHITGDPSFVGEIDSKKIQSALIGKDKKDFAKIIMQERNISTAEATIRPLWKTVFPLDPTKITVKISTK